MKKTICLVLLCCCVLSFSACGAPADSGSFSIDDVIAHLDDFSTEELQALDSALNDKLGVEASQPSSSQSAQTPDINVSPQQMAEGPAADFIYVSNGSEIQINGYQGPGGDVAIPNEIDGLPVTRIAEKAFYENENITGLTLPESIKAIGEDAFSLCSNLSGIIVLPASLEEVGSFAFMYAAINGFVIKCSCDLSYALSFNDGLEFVYVEDGASPSFNSSFTCDDALKTVVFPATVTTLKGDDLFEGLNSVTIYTPEGSAAATYGTNHFVAVDTANYESMAAQFAEF